VSAELEHVAMRAATWSETANHLKARLEFVRWLVFGLSIAGALAAAIASQIPVDPNSGVPAHALFDLNSEHASPLECHLLAWVMNSDGKRSERHEMSGRPIVSYLQKGIPSKLCPQVSFALQHAHRVAPWPPSPLHCFWPAGH
jgi:hypothetical protein